MNKNLMALAAMAFAGVACAQTSGSSVTLWGVVDADVSHYSQGGVSRTFMSSSGNNGDQLGFRGTEDLGGGLSASFWLEGSFTPQNGNAGGLAFNRRSTVSLAGHFGEIRLGDDYTPSFWNHWVFDPFHDSGPGAGSNVTLTGGGNTSAGANPLTAVRASNAIEYLWGFVPNGLAVAGRGVYAQLMYAFPGNTSGQPSIGEYAGGRLGYASGPVNVALSYAQSHGKPIPGETGLDTTYKESNLAGSYDFGMATVMAHYGVNNSDVAATRYTHWGLGATINAGPGYIPVSYNRIKQNDATSDGADQIAVGYVYNLSRRTALYATVSHISNKNNGHYTFVGSNGGGNPQLYLAPGFNAANGGLAGSWGSGTGYDVGLRTSF